MKFHGGVSWDEQYDMPVVYKRWFLERLAKELAKDGAATETAAGPSTPQRRINFNQLQRAFGGADQ